MLKMPRTLRHHPPRQHSAASAHDPDNQTDPMPGQESWSIHDLPDILYQLRPVGRQIRKDLALPTKPSPWAKSPPLRIFPILPDRISSNVEEWRVEAWMRMDRRIRLRDITERMNPAFRIANNALQQRGVRFRKAFNILSWGTGNKKTGLLADNLEAKMRRHGLNPNLGSTRGLTPGLVDPELGEKGGRIPIPEPYRSRYLQPQKPSRSTRALDAPVKELTDSDASDRHHGLSESMPSDDGNAVTTTPSPSLPRNNIPDGDDDGDGDGEESKELLPLPDFDLGSTLPPQFGSHADDINLNLDIPWMPHDETPGIPSYVPPSLPVPPSTLVPIKTDPLDSELQYILSPGTDISFNSNSSVLESSISFQSSDEAESRSVSGSGTENDDTLCYSFGPNAARGFLDYDPGWPMS